ncbi:hypothetical protein [Desulfogranum japonicum]|uniref:hypothetical protein n=1 Tax=Desulfogranum japonicum TaxID=231447 RepID=UPI00048D1EA9|nr:hypothetical protein [Desulfogranum japonicum]
MPTINLVQASAHMADKVYLMSAVVNGHDVDLTNLGGGGISFTCTNDFATIKDANNVKITYDNSVPQQHEEIQVSSVHGP